MCTFKTLNYMLSFISFLEAVVEAAYSFIGFDFQIEYTLHRKELMQDWKKAKGQMKRC